MTEHTLVHGPNGTTLTVHRDIQRLDSHSGFKVPDPDWVAYCDKGCRHMWVGEEVPTLDYAIVDTYWDEDICDEYALWGYTCKECGDTVEPGYVTSYAPQFVQGVMTYTIDGVMCTKDQFEKKCDELREQYDDVPEFMED